MKPIKLTRKQIKEGLEQIPMDSLLLGTAASQIGATLTPKQREFARLVALGESKASSYRKAYNSKGKSKTQAQEGWRLSTRPDVAQMTEAFAQAKAFTDSHTPEQLRAFIVQQLTQHAANNDNPPSVRLNALKILGTVAEIGAFETRAVVQHVKASGDIRERILDKLKLIGASSTIEHNAAQDDEQDAESLLSELHQTHTIDAGAIISDEVIPEYQPENDCTARDSEGLIPLGYRKDDEVSENTGLYPECITSGYIAESSAESGGVASDPAEGDPTPRGEPLNRGVFPELDTHNIPHIQICDLSIPHTQSSTEVNPRIQTSSFEDQHTSSSVSDATVTHSSDVSADGDLSVETDTGLDPTEDGELSTGSVDK